ncbi:MAG: sugar ABC transporter substrate-binding protein, partial [Solirubrobacteraceae bacterium]
AVAVGPSTGPATIAEKKAFGAYAAAHPNFHIQGYIYTDYTTPTTYTATQSYLQANPNTTLIMSVYSPDLTRGVISALKTAGKLGKIKVTDQGGSSYSIQQIKAGNIEFTMPYFPENTGLQAVKSLIAAAQGTAPARFVDVVPSQYGTYLNPLAITSKNVSSFTPEY